MMDANWFSLVDKLLHFWRLVSKAWADPAFLTMQILHKTIDPRPYASTGLNKHPCPTWFLPHILEHEKTWNLNKRNSVLKFSPGNTAFKYSFLLLTVFSHLTSMILLYGRKERNSSFVAHQSRKCEVFSYLGSTRVQWSMNFDLVCGY